MGMGTCTMKSIDMPASLMAMHVPPARPATAAEMNVERLHLAVTSAWKDGHDLGEHVGYLAGARAGRIAAFCWGLAAGIGLVSVGFWSGLLVVGG